MKMCNNFQLLKKASQYYEYSENIKNIKKEQFEKHSKKESIWKEEAWFSMAADKIDS